MKTPELNLLTATRALATSAALMPACGIMALACCMALPQNASGEQLITQSSAYAGASARSYSSLTEQFQTGLYLAPAFANVDIDSGTFAHAQSDYGVMRVKASAFTHATGASGDDHTAVANTECQWVDTIQIFPPDVPGLGPTIGTFRFRVDGTLLCSASQNLANSGIRYTFDVYDGNGNAIGTAQTGSFYRWSTGATEGADFTGTTNTLSFTLPDSFRPGQQITLRLVFMAGAAANATEPGVDEDVSASADLSHTVLFEGMTFAQGGSPLDVQMISQSGFDWSKAYSETNTPVRLQIRRSANQFSLLWPSDAVNYVLEKSPTLGLGAQWTSAGDPTLDNGMNVVTIPTDGGAQFYRLRKTP